MPHAIEVTYGKGWIATVTRFNSSASTPPRDPRADWGPFLFLIAFSALYVADYFLSGRFP